jgi:tetratricopeptide (TPR) repeat protein
LRQSRTGETLAGLRRARAAYALAREGENPRLVRRGLNVVAMCQASHGMFIEAVADAIDAYSAATTAADQVEACHAIATIVGSTGLMLGGRAHSEAAHHLLGRCLAIALERNDVFLECRVRMLRAMRLGSADRFDEAEQDFSIALARVDDTPNNIPAAMIVLNLAALSIKRAKKLGALHPEYWDRAVIHNAESLELAVRHQNPAVESRSYFNIADVHKWQGRADDAMRYFDRALAVASKWKQRDQIINTQVERAALLAMRGDVNEALVAYEHAFHEAELHRPTPQLAVIAAKLAAAYESKPAGLHVADHDLAESELLRKHWQRIADSERILFERESAETKATLERFWANAETAIPMLNPQTSPTNP